MSQVIEPSLHDQAQAALQRHAWAEAFDLLSKADAAEGLDPQTLELLAESAWWTGRLSDAIDARERAYAAATKAGDMAMAVLLAIRLGTDNTLRQAHSEANGWLNRADGLGRD